MAAAGTVSKVWTFTLTNNIYNMTAAHGLVILSIMCKTGTVNLLGEQTINGVASTPITLSEGQAITISSGDNSSIIIDGLTIDATSGSAALIGR